MSLARRVALAALLAVLADASACLVAPLRDFAREGEPIAMSAACHCGCTHRPATLGGVGLAQLAAPPAEIALPPAVRPEPPRAAPPALPSAPARAIDHVPISRV